MNELWQVGFKIGLSALLAGAIGAEREWTGKWAGLRTHMLIAVGAALLTDVSIGIGARFHGVSAAWDPGRIAAQIVSGVGFLGAGALSALVRFHGSEDDRQRLLALAASRGASAGSRDERDEPLDPADG